MNRPAGVITSSSSPDVQGVDDALAERAAGQLLHADPQQPRARRRTDREATALAVVAADREVLAVHEAVVVGEVGGYGEGERDRVVGQRLDGGHPERVEAGAWSSTEALKWSNGSRQERQTHRLLQAVEPNRLDSRVSRLPHCGQRTDRVSADRPVGTGTDRPRRRDAGLGELGAALLGQVVGGPGGAEHELDVDVLVAGAGQRLDEVGRGSSPSPGSRSTSG